MGKLVAPWSPKEYSDPEFLPNACWWRHAMIHFDEERQALFVWTLEKEKGWIQLEWFDGLDTIIDAGMDSPTVAAIAQIFVDPIEYIDLLAEERPSPSFYRITKYGDRNHPGAIVCHDLDYGSYGER